MDKETWKEVSEKDKGEIRVKSKELLDAFSKKLESISGYEEHFENNDGSRAADGTWSTDEEFRGTMFSNAPMVENDFLVAEKAGWGK